MTADYVSSRIQKVSLFRFLFLILSFLALLTSNPVFYREAFCAQVTLAWDPESESGLAGYKVHYGTVSRNYSFIADAGNQAAATITGLTAGVTYYFAATAYDTGGSESAPSNEVTYTLPTSCSFSIAPANKSFATAAGTGSVSVATQSGCSWTTASPASWVRITSGASGTGNGTVNYSVDANTGASSRTAGLTIAGAVFTVTQAGVSTYPIIASAGANGSISPSGSVSVNAGASRSFTITPSSGYQVANVTVDGSSVGTVTSYTFSNVTATHTVTASFSAVPPSSYTLAISKAGRGSGTVTTNPSGTSFSAGTSVTLTAAASTGSTFGGWSRGCSGTATSCTIMMNAAKSVTATFTLNTYVITASAGANGAISPSGQVSVTQGASQSFTITPAAGYTVASLTVDGASVAASTSYTFSSVTANHTITASFATATTPPPPAPGPASSLNILWQHQATGTLSAWLMNGTTMISLAPVTPGGVSDTNWKIVGTGDFNGDGKPDILWQHQTTGSLSVWLMNGTSLASLAPVTPGRVSDTNWKIVGIGDFDNDGKPDILWQHQTTGSLSVWLMNGTSLASLAPVTPGGVSDTNWKIVGIGDFNNDGKPDILWQHQTTGSLSVWLMNGTSLASLAPVTPGRVSDTNWKIVGIGDFDNDGKPDILWQHQTTGSLSVWLMNGTSLASLAPVTPGRVSDTNWKIVGL